MSEVKRQAEEAAEDVSQDTKKPKLEQTSAPKGIQETDVGITTYLSQDLGGFVGTIKQRYTDFLVSEIDLNDNVIYLTDEGFADKRQRRRERREKEREEQVESDEEVKTEAPVKTPAEEEKPREFQLDAAHRIKLLELFGEEELSKIEELLTNKGTFSSAKQFNEKKQRGEIHQLFREAFEGRFETKTSPENTFQFSIASRNSRKNKQQQPEYDTRDENGIENYGLGPLKEFLHFTLYKENKETMEAANLISRFLRLQPKQIRYAGTKDRRGVTTQRMAISKMKVERLNSLNKALRGMRLGGFSYEDKGLSLGDLHGNEFLITLRDVKSLDSTQNIEEVVAKSLESLKKTGFINYYGMQRFGTFSVSTHQVGKEILLSNWKNAVELILSEQELVLPDSINARKIWAEDKDAKEAFDAMPRKCIAESTILRELSNSKIQEDGSYSDNNYFNAINKIPRNLRIMYGHAYQSYIWNTVASRRIELFGLNVVAGDLVLDDSTKEAATEPEEEQFEEDIRTDRFQRARPVTQEEVDTGKFTIYDIVLPTPGFDIRYPENQQLLQVYKDTMGADGLDPLQMTRKVKEFSFAGSYRNLVAKAKNLEHQIRRYSEPTQQLVYTDLELLRAKQKGEEKERVLPQTEEGSERVAVILRLQLDVSAYATMALREVMKADTSRHGDLCDVRI